MSHGAVSTWVHSNRQGKVGVPIDRRWDVCWKWSASAYRTPQMCLDKPKEKPVKHVKTHPIFDNVHSVREILSEMILLALLLSHFHAKKQRPGHRWKRLPQIVRIGIPRFMRTTEWNTSAFESLDVAPGTPFPMLCHATLLFPSCWRSWRPSLNMTIRYYKYGCIHCGISMNIPITFPWYPKLWPWHTGDSKALKSDGATLAWGPVGSETGLWERERVALQNDANMI